MQQKLKKVKSCLRRYKMDDINQKLEELFDDFSEEQLSLTVRNLFDAAKRMLAKKRIDFTMASMYLFDLEPYSEETTKAEKRLLESINKTSDLISPYNTLAEIYTRMYGSIKERKEKEHARNS